MCINVFPYNTTRQVVIELALLIKWCVKMLTKVKKRLTNTRSLPSIKVQISAIKKNWRDEVGATFSRLLILVIYTATYKTFLKRVHEAA